MDQSRSPIGAGVTVAQLEADPHPVLRRLRCAEPVSWVPALGGWLVTRRDLALTVMRDAATFTVDDPRFSTARVVGPSMLSLDGAQHVRHRSPFAAPFRKSAIEDRFATFVGTEVERLVRAIEQGGQADIRRSVAGPLAVAVVAEALGLGHADPTAVLEWYATIVGAVSTVSVGGELDPAALDAVSQLGDRVRATIDGGRHRSLLADAAASHHGLAPGEIVSNVAVLMFGGVETVEGMILNALLHVLVVPDLLVTLRDDEALVANAVEESLRLEPAAAVVDRYATADVTLGSAAIDQGELVIVSLAGANRDPATFSDPDAFDVGRVNANQHLAFAHGPHLCVGMDLARLETIETLRRLVRLPGLRLDPDAARPVVAGLVFRKPPALHVCWDR